MKMSSLQIQILCQESDARFFQTKDYVGSSHFGSQSQTPREDEWLEQ